MNKPCVHLAATMRLMRVEQKKARRWRPWRFSLRVLLMMPVLVGCAMTWLTWPDRTLRRFKQLADDGQTVEARRMMRLEDGFEYELDHEGHGPWLSVESYTDGRGSLLDESCTFALKPQTHSCGDLIAARRVITYNRAFEITVQRGYILVDYVGPPFRSPYAKQSPTRFSSQRSAR